MKRLSKILAIGAIAILSTHAALTVKGRTSAKVGGPAPKTFVFLEEDEHGNLLTDIPGLEVNQVYRPEQAGIGQAAGVIGILVNGKARAYLMNGMSTPGTHIAYDQIDGEGVAVAFCDQTGAARVFCGDSDELRSIRVGGWANDNMQLIVGEERFAVDSKDIQVKEQPFETMSWGEWQARHPDTEIYLGDILPQTP